MTEQRAGLPIIAFNDLAAFERWLGAQRARLRGARQIATHFGL
jgi:hypothetical protein